MSPVPSRELRTLSAAEVAFHRSPPRHRWLAIVVAAAAGLVVPVLILDSAAAQVLGAIWLGLCAHVACRHLERAAERHPVVVIDARGILDTRLLPRPIEWGEIASFYPIDVSRSHVVELRLRNPHRSLADAPCHMRLGLDWFRKLDLPDVCINLVLLDGTVTEVIEAIRCHAPHRVPRTQGYQRRGVRVRVEASSRQP